MITKEQIDLQIKSMTDDFNNQYPEALYSFFAKIDSALVESNYEIILYCVEEIAKYYNIDTNYSNSFKILYKTRELLREYVAEERKQSKLKKSLFLFWTSFYTWFQSLKNENINMFQDKYLCGHYELDYYEHEYWVNDGIQLNENIAYKIEFGTEFKEPTEKDINFEFVKNYIEFVLSKYIKPAKEGRYQFAVQVNNTFKKFNLPYRLSKGKVIKSNYKTSLIPDKILNFEQFERKIEFSELMIIHDDFMDKHTALEYIADSFCFFKSLFKGGNSERAKEIAKIVTDNENSSMFNELVKEIQSIYEIVDGNFDIRHNEYYNSKIQKHREPLKDVAFIEYLYNRIFALLYLLRLNYKK